MKSTSPFHLGARRIRMILLAGLISGAGLTRGEGLWQAYEKAIQSDFALQAAAFRAEAAAQHVTTQSRLYLPRVTLLARELWTDLNVSEPGNRIFPEGRAGYETTRVMVELDQPLFDTTIRASVDAAKARQRQIASLSQQDIQRRTGAIAEAYVRAARLHQLRQANNRVIDRLEEELTNITQSHGAKIATLTDVQNVQLALSALRRERNQFQQQWYTELARVGIDAKDISPSAFELNPSADPAAIGIRRADSEIHGSDATRLQAEADEMASRMQLANQRTWPTISLYGRYEQDAAGGSVFGGPRDVSAGEVGLSLRWNMFDRGMNRSESREYYLHKQAKEAELKAHQMEESRIVENGRRVLEQSARNVQELADLVKQHNALADSARRAYEAGTESYINSLSAYLAYESTDREWTSARYEQLLHNAQFAARIEGWTVDLVREVSGQFRSVD